jgi:hypothetical protein
LLPRPQVKVYVREHQHSDLDYDDISERLSKVTARLPKSPLLLTARHD